ncbi:MAG: adenylate cyclase [Verrucomicrobiota bacterium]|jgi:class 3 adenylate cyclase
MAAGEGGTEKEVISNEPASKEKAWLEGNDSKKIQLEGGLTIGRSPKNVLILDSQKVSRRHAVINVQNIGEFWLIDLGSSNGTFLSGRRLHQPVRLCDQDQIIIGDRVFTFRQPEEITDEYRTTFAERTIREIANVPCWLLVADIENFTPLSRSLTSDKLATLIGGWVATCKEIIEAHTGMIDKYLGDGFFAYWREDANAAKNVAAALDQLKQAQARNEPRFRLALHFGLVAIGGVPSMGEESLMGKDVNFVFRMEKLAGSLKISVLTSTAGKDKLGPLINIESAGAHELKGFEGKFEFFSC